MDNFKTFVESLRDSNNGDLIDVVLEGWGIYSNTGPNPEINDINGPETGISEDFGEGMEEKMSEKADSESDSECEPEL